MLWYYVGRGLVGQLTSGCHKRAILRHPRSSPAQASDSSIRTFALQSSQSTIENLHHINHVQEAIHRGKLLSLFSHIKLTITQNGAKNVVTLFHKPSNQASTRVLTLLKQANAQSVAHATEDQASSHDAHTKAERTEFELDVTEAPPTPDQLKNILEYLGGPSAAGKVISGASDEGDALRRLKADGEVFQRPLVRSPYLLWLGKLLMFVCRWWTGIKAKQVSHRQTFASGSDIMLTCVVAGENESAILNLVRSISKEGEKA